VDGEGSHPQHFFYNSKNANASTILQQVISKNCAKIAFGGNAVSISSFVLSSLNKNQGFAKNSNSYIFGSW